MKVDLKPLFERDVVLTGLRAHLLGIPVNREIVNCAKCPYNGQPNCSRALLKDSYYYLLRKEDNNGSDC